MLRATEKNRRVWHGRVWHNCGEGWRAVKRFDLNPKTLVPKSLAGLRKALGAESAPAESTDLAPVTREALILSADELSSADRGELERGGRGPLPLVADDALLSLLREASNDELAPLVEILRVKGGRTSQLAQTASFRAHFPDHRAYVEDIVADLQKFGGNTLANQVLREGRGVPYEVILENVAKRVGVAYRGRTAHEIETEIVARIMSEAYAKMSREEQAALLRSLKIRDRRKLLAPGGTEALRLAIQHSGFAAYKASAIAANAVSQQLLGHGLSLAANAGLAKGIAVFAGPVGLAFTAFLVGHSVAGPAYRVTVPAVIHIAAVRAARTLPAPSRWERVREFVREHWLVLVLLVVIGVLAVMLVRHR